MCVHVHERAEVLLSKIDIDHTSHERYWTQKPYQIAKMLTFEKSYLPLQSRLAPILGTDSQKVRFVVIPCGDVGSKLTFGQSNR